MQEPVFLAMWSGPRNLSTALMRSFENRSDSRVVDEPFYGAYLKLSGADHPMRARILESMETDWRKIAKSLTQGPVGGKTLVYQKHMTHHMVPGIGLEWTPACRHAFLIRHPARVLASYARKRQAVDLRDLGYRRQVELFTATGSTAPILDADALLSDPRGHLTILCDALGIGFQESMLNWPPGPRSSDGIWAQHWYDAVYRSTGFQEARPMPELTDPALAAICEAALPDFEYLAGKALHA